MRSLPRSHGTGEKDFPSQGPEAGQARPGAADPLPPARGGLGLGLLLLGRRSHAMPRFGGAGRVAGCPMRF